ncbi:MAG: tRNA adenosine(34) deaminase TadA [Halanaerobium sp.]|nr:tRNA adenosine(34) deaminase TadA [Halanaerobium sp.]
MQHERWMAEALAEAKKASALQEVPIGAVIVKDGEVLGRGHNLKETTGDPTAHAEILAIKDAAEKVGDWRLEGATIYVTLEPCPMCAGAIVQARLPRLVFGADDPKAGACGSLLNLVEDQRFNHQVEVIKGISAHHCRKLLQDFFQSLRKREG